MEIANFQIVAQLIDFDTPGHLISALIGIVGGKIMNQRKKNQLTFVELVESIRVTHNLFSVQAVSAVNISLTLRNWVIGLFIREYEQNGKDRAEYGAQIIEKLAAHLQKGIDECYSDRYLRLCRQFYGTYPQIRKSLISKFDLIENRKSLISQLPINPTDEPTSEDLAISVRLEMPPEKLLRQLSFTHFIELLRCDDPLKRLFYEVECIRGNWSVRELKRQISTLYYERSGLSTNKKKLAALVQSKVAKDESSITIRDPYIFEFLGIKSKEVMGESDIENALLDKLQEFLLELGYGFCFEARQKRILIGSKYFFVDLVFYHRILKCHVLIELKLHEFNHEHLGQLNTYVNWYKKNVMTDGDNPPVGILLCSVKDHSLIEYALAGLDNSLFVSKYQLELPKKEEMQSFIDAQLREVEK
ncbi:MAG TPA: PDDEXK nuclease domain-containing protein [Candidatus Deferrimicrobium sp.]|nr:PDDEXK nuclease domain-containing protein [Candidatus Deferrimicrobium sp.]